MPIQVVNQNVSRSADPKVGQKAEPSGPVRDRRVTREDVPEEWEYPIFDADDFIIEGPASVEIVDRTGQQIQMDAVEAALERYMESTREPGIISIEHDDVPIGIPIWEWESGDVPRYETTVTDDEFTLVANIGNETTKGKMSRMRCLNGDYAGYSVTVYSNREHTTADGTRVTVDCDLHAVTLGSTDRVANPEADFDVVDFKYGGLLEGAIQHRLRRRQSLAGKVEQKLQDVEVLDDERSRLQVFFVRPSEELIEENEAYEHVLFSWCGLYAPLNASIFEVDSPGIGISARSSDKYLPDNCVRLITDVGLGDIDIGDVHQANEGSYVGAEDYAAGMLKDVGVLADDEQFDSVDELFFRLTDHRLDPEAVNEYLEEPDQAPLDQKLDVGLEIGRGGGNLEEELLARLE